MIGILVGRCASAVLAFAIPATVAAFAELLDSITRARRERQESAQVSQLIEESHWHTVGIGDSMFSMGPLEEAKTLIGDRTVYIQVEHDDEEDGELQCIEEHQGCRPGVSTRSSATWGASCSTSSPAASSSGGSVKCPGASLKWLSGNRLW